MIQNIKAASSPSNNSKNSTKKHLLDICLWYDGGLILFF